MVKRKANCKICEAIFESGTRGAIPRTCPTCRRLDYHYRYGNAYVPRALERAKYRCEDCKKSSVKLYVHHKDGHGVQEKHPNNSDDNLKVLCGYCHMKAHKLVKVSNLKTIQRLRKQHMTFQKIANRYGVSRQRIHQLISRAENKT